ncbi:hypothetical protein [Leifsonia sp. LS-T14]|uniref:hypothetical protein n=1 Tax=unclassified Leifsonia TaxID=2663824 RepID=UPI0035A587A0
MLAFVVVAHDSVGREVSEREVVARLSPSDRARLASLADDPAGAARFLAGRAALFTAAERLGEADIHIDARCPDCGLAHGRPRAEAAGAPVHLALAHAGASAFAVAARAPVGIDAEPLTVDADRLAAIDDLAPGRGDPLRRWTAIEAVLKADGRGLRLAPDTVRVGLRSARLDGVRYGVTTSRAADCVVTVAERHPLPGEVHVVAAIRRR